MNDKYKYTEKERDTESGWDYFGARYYDSELSRWLQVDPLNHLRPGLTPYNYCQNNPLLFIDPRGLLDTRYEDEEGNLLAETKDGNDATVVIPNFKKEDFFDEYNNTSLLARDGKETNAEWIQKYGGAMYAYGDAEVQDWAISSIGASTAGFGAAILNETYGHTTFRIYNSKGFSPKLYNGWAGNQYVNTFSAGKVLKGTGFVAGAFSFYQSAKGLILEGNYSIKSFMETGIGVWGWLGGSYGAAASLGYEVGKLKPLKAIFGFDSEKFVRGLLGK